MKNIPKRLKQVKKEKGLTTSEISRLLNIHAPTWCKYENGTSNMSLETLYKFCKTLNVSADWLLGFKSENKISDNPQEDLCKLSVSDTKNCGNG